MCDDCVKPAKNKKRTFKEFIVLANLKHNNKYLYFEPYINTDVKITIKHIACNHVFTQAPTKHLSGSGCPECGKKSQLKTFEDFKNQANIKHNNNYTYFEPYVNTHTYIKIHHNLCGYDFPQTPNSHLLGSGCPQCFKKIKYTLKTFIKEANATHNKEYSYFGPYVNNSIKILIRHKKCGKLFTQTPRGHLTGKVVPIAQII